MNVFNYYDVDEYCVVFNKKSGNAIKPSLNEKGYLKVQIRINGVRKNVKVHRMVCTKYLANPMCYPMVNHKDGNKANNHVSNLEWCDARYNANHAIDSGLMIVGSKRSSCKLSREDVLDARLRYSRGETQTSVYSSYSDKIGWWSFRDILRGKTYKDLIV